MSDNSSDNNLLNEISQNNKINHTVSINESSPEEPNMFFKYLQLFGDKVLLLDSLRDSSGYKYYLSLLWIMFAGIIYLIASGVKSTQTAFILYSSDVWIVALAVVIFFIG